MIKQKNAYMFTLDAIIAIIILAVVAALLLSTTTGQEPTTYIDHAAQDVINVLSNTKVSDVCDLETKECPNYQALQPLLEHTTPNQQTSLLELIDENIIRGVSSAEDMTAATQELLSNIIDEQRFGVSLAYTPQESNDLIELYNTQNP